MTVAAVDVQYGERGATAAAVFGSDAGFAEIVGERTARVAGAAPYRPGALAQRELPAIKAVLLGSQIELLVVDGYVTLDPEGRPGLGAHAHRELSIPVIGIAKSMFRSATHAVPVLRGGATRPLFVTAVGVPAEEAAELVRAMAGQFRLPDAVRRADRLARGGT